MNAPIRGSTASDDCLGDLLLGYAVIVGNIEQRAHRSCYGKPLSLLNFIVSQLSLVQFATPQWSFAEGRRNGEMGSMGKSIAQLMEK